MASAADLFQIDMLNRLLNGEISPNDIPLNKKNPADTYLSRNPPTNADMSKGSQVYLAKDPSVPLAKPVVKPPPEPPPVSENNYKKPTESGNKGSSKVQEVKSMPSPASSPSDEGALNKFNMNESPIGEAYRKNINNNLEAIGERSAQVADQYDAANAEAGVTRDFLKKYLAATIARANNGFQYKEPQYTDTNAMRQQILKQMQDINNMPNDLDTTSKLIYALGPAVLGLATGGYAGNMSAAPTFKTAMDMADAERKALNESKKSRLESAGKQLSGLGEITKGEAEKNKAQFEAQKYGSEYQDKVYKEAHSVIKDLMEDPRVDKKMLFSELSKLDQSALGKIMPEGAKQMADIALREKKLEIDKNAPKLRNQFQQERLKLMIDRMGQQDFRRITTDKIVGPLIQSHMAIKNDIDTLNKALASGNGVEPQIMREISNGIASALSVGRQSNALSDREAMEYKNFNTTVAEMLTKAGRSGVRTINDPKLFRQMSDSLQRLRASFEKRIEERASDLVRGSSFEEVNAQQRDAVEKMTDFNKYSSDVVEYARKNNISVEKANEIKMKRQSKGAK